MKKRSTFSRPFFCYIFPRFFLTIITMSDKKYRFGISTTVDYTVPLESQLETIAACGFEFISIGASPMHSHFYDRTACRECIKLAGQHSLEIKSAHVPFWEEYDLAAIRDEAAQGAVEKVVEFLELTADYGIPAAILHPHYYFSDDKVACLKRSIASIERVVAKKPSSLRIDIENLPDNRGSWICARLLDRFGTEEIGFCFDSSHENMSGPPFHILEKYWPRITQTHLSDNRGTDDDHFIPGEGNIDWQILRSYLDKNPTLTDLLFEVGTGEKLEMPFAEFVQKAAQAAKKYFS